MKDYKQIITKKLKPNNAILEIKKEKLTDLKIKERTC